MNRSITGAAELAQRKHAYPETRYRDRAEA